MKPPPDVSDADDCRRIAESTLDRFGVILPVDGGLGASNGQPPLG